MTRWTWIRRYRGTLAAALGLMLLVAVGLGIWFGWDWKAVIGWKALVHYIDPKDATDRKDTVQVYAVIVAGVVASITAAVGLLNLRLTRRNLEQQRELEAQRSEHQRELEAQRSEQQRKLAQGTALQAYYEQIGKLITDKDLLNTERKEIRELARGHTLTVLQEVDAKGKGSLLTFLHGAGLIEADNPAIDLSGAALQNADFPPGANLRGANLQGVNLLNARLLAGYLQGANLRGTSLRGADLQSADLQSADLRRARLRGVNLSQANLQGANLQGAELYKADLPFTALQAANLRGANLYGANLYGANLHGADLHGAKLHGADLQLADLQLADLQLADLYGVNLYLANLYLANLRGADLRGADLREVRGLTQELIEWTIGSNETRLGQDLNRPERWSKRKVEQMRIVRGHIDGG